MSLLLLDLFAGSVKFLNNNSLLSNYQDCRFQCGIENGTQYFIIVQFLNLKLNN